MKGADRNLAFTTQSSEYTKYFLHHDAQISHTMLMGVMSSLLLNQLIIKAKFKWLKQVEGKGWLIPIYD